MKAAASEPGAFKPCALVPVYNHGRTALAVVRGLLDRGLVSILVDDGSDGETKACLAEVVAAVPGTILATLPENRGKGGAVIEGLKRAKEEGYSHALQVDADGQHDLGEVGAFIEAAKAEPLALVAGAPVYDESAPRSRLMGRKITNFWTTIETLSRDLKDAMCGFRVYPVGRTLRAASYGLLSRRMGFDIEILVRLHWDGKPLRFLPVRVIYPEGGISNFRMLEDNVLISLVHTKLFFGMLLRSPLILGRRLWRSLCRLTRSIGASSAKRRAG
jgi:glycosyltransferase involved in cell wall biosynthesis